MLTKVNCTPILGNNKLRVTYVDEKISFYLNEQLLIDAFDVKDFEIETDGSFSLLDYNANSVIFKHVEIK
ncbi:hypothetical protein [Spiroplasma clarkii]|uniref:hypothetical protein n=1 Tax=Spiroplasma clarkii TaxID=2139 RepID=UPI0011BAD6A3|nr:hypothetical protein [Spiroplasma clarkii]